MNRPFVHIGYHKTGSTLLQHTLLSRRDLGFQMLENDRKRIHGLFVQYGPFDCGAAAADMLRNEADQAAGQGLRLVISHERLSGYFASGGYDSKQIADRIHCFFPDAKILIVVREQRSMLYTQYLQYLTDGGDLSLGNLLKDPQPRIRRQPICTLDYFCYHKLVEYYQNRFGRKNVLVLPYELLRKDPHDFAERVVRFGRPDEMQDQVPRIEFPTRVNSANPLLLQSIRRHLNRHCTRSHLSPRALIHIPHLGPAIERVSWLASPLHVFDGFLRHRLRKHVDRLASGYYGDSNQQLSQQIGFDLEEFGYDVRSSSANDLQSC